MEICRKPLPVTIFSTERILAALGERYDRIVIDAGDDFNSGLAVSALNACDRRIFVLTQQPEWLQLPESPVQFLSSDKLNQDWHSLRGELSPEELDQIHYWNPQTVGEIVFNTWD